MYEFMRLHKAKCDCRLERSGVTLTAGSSGELTPAVILTLKDWLVLLMPEGLHAVRGCLITDTWVVCLPRPREK